MRLSHLSAPRIGVDGKTCTRSDRSRMTSFDRVGQRAGSAVRYHHNSIVSKTVQGTARHRTEARSYRELVAWESFSQMSQSQSGEACRLQQGSSSSTGHRFVSKKCWLT
jgi:hypothetical protein